MTVNEKTEELFRRIREKCQDRGWFGADEWMEPGFRNRPPFRTNFPPVSSLEQLESIEHQLGFPLPGLLRDLYLHLANGEFGFGYGIVSGEDLFQEYRSIAEKTSFDGAWRWPERLIPLCYWGCSMYSYLDIERDIVLFADIEGLFDEEGDFLVEAPSLAAWLERWITKQDRHPPLVEREVGTHAGREQFADDDEDPQARAMGLEKWEDDPHTPVPPYVEEYRRQVGQ